MGVAVRWRRRPHDAATGVTGRARVGGRAAEVARRAAPGDLAVIDEVDLDADSARALLAAGVAGVIDVSPATTGRYPNLGPQVLAEAGVPLVDGVGRGVLARVHDDDVLRLDQGDLWRGDRQVGRGRVLDAAAVAAVVADARAGLAAQLEAFAGGVREHLGREGDLLLDGEGLPPLRTALRGRDVLVVAPGARAAADVRRVWGWIHEARPVLVGVGAGSDVLLDDGLRPDLVVTDGTDASEAALGCGAEVVLVARDDPSRPSAAGSARRGLVVPTGVAELLGLAEPTGLAEPAAVVGPTSASAEDVALLLAEHAEADLVVLAGASSTLVELIDRDRAGLAVTVLTRLRAGARVLDARVLARLHRPRPSPARVLVVAVGALLAAAVGVAAGVVPSSDVLQRLRAGRAAAPDGQARVAGLEAEVAGLDRDLAAAQGLTARLVPLLVERRLTGQRVVLVVLPGADPRVVDAVRDVVRRAGADVSGTVTLTPTLLDPGRTDQLDDLVGRLAPADAPVTGEDAPARLVTAVARALVASAPSRIGKPDDASTSLLSGLEELGALRADSAAYARAGLAVVVAGGGAPASSGAQSPAPSAQPSAGADALATRLTTALGLAGRGVVAVAAAPTGADLLGRIRRDPVAGPVVSTVDDAGTDVGGLATVLALAEQAAGGAGHYGQGTGVDGPIPPVPGMPAPTTPVAPTEAHG